MERKIAIVNAHWNNRGDEAALRAVIDDIIENYPDSKITIIFKDKGNIVQFPYQERVRYIVARFLLEEYEMVKILTNPKNEGIPQDIKDTMDVIELSDYVIYAPGGAVISDRFWWKKQLEYLFPVAYAEKMNKPVFFAAPSIGPFNCVKKIRTDILRRAETICVREEISREELLRQEVSSNVMVTIDCAFLNGINETYATSFISQDIELKKFMNRYNRIVGVTITDLTWHVEYGKDLKLVDRINETFTSFISAMENEGTGVLLIPQLFGNQNDTMLLERFSNCNTCILKDTYDTFVQQYIISKLYCIIGMRYHSNIFAAKAGIPFISIIYEEKMEGFLQKYNFIDWSIKIEQLNADILLCKYFDLVDDNNNIKKRISMKKNEWQNEAKKTESILLDFLK